MIRSAEESCSPLSGQRGPARLAELESTDLTAANSADRHFRSEGEEIRLAYNLYGGHRTGVM
jgi:hypothetical protein